ncbi:MAG: recombinase family protein, partial [Oscillospiraceae bacterium]|nr:recombinase family protein [Oscillospiraceae bacterium]
MHQKSICIYEGGKIDIIFTKSVSRMGRNTLDLLNIIRELRSIGIRIIFQQEDLNSSKYEDELLITLIEAFAQAESTERSENIRWGLDKRMQDGTSGLYK